MQGVVLFKIQILIFPITAYNDAIYFIVPTLEENGIFILGLVFFIQSIFGDRNNSFQQNFYTALKILTF